MTRSAYLRELWPVVYILSNENTKEAYIGESTDACSRFNVHLKTPEKKKLKDAHIITSEKFNKSATLDIESNLIKYISGDGQFQLINGNIGLAKKIVQAIKDRDKEHGLSRLVAGYAWIGCHRKTRVYLIYA